MKHVYQYRIVWIGLLMCAVCLLGSAAEANLTAQSSSGTVEVLRSGEQTWQALTATTKLEVGDQVRTGPNSAVDLWFEDGSVLNLAEGTQLTITELDISTANKTRVARFQLEWGMVTVKITKLAFTENVCEIETDSVVAGVAFAEMTVKHPQNSSESEIVANQGQVTVRRLAADDRVVRLIGSLTEQEGVQLVLPRSVGAEVFLSVQKILGTIEVQSSVPLTDIRPLFDPLGSFVKIDNEGLSPMMAQVQNSSSVLGAQGSATVGIPPDQELLITTQGETDLAFSIKRRTAAILCEGLYVFLNGGELTVNDETVSAGVPNCFPVIQVAQQPEPQAEGKGRSLIQTEPASRDMIGAADEVPVVPGAPQSQSPGTIVVEPSPTPTPTPTETPTPEPTETPTPTPTPTETPEPGGDDVPPPPPPPAPTQTPSSPVLP